MPDNKGKPKKERKPLTEAQRLQRQKMIVLPVMVLVFIGAMWLIFAPSSETEQKPGTGGYNIEMPDADKADRQIIGDKLKAYEQAAMEERLEERDHAVRQLGDMFDREMGDTGDGGGFDLSTPEGKEDGAATQTIRSSAAAYRDLNATLGNFYEEPARNDAEMEKLMERISLLESELESEKEKSSTMDEQVALMEKSYELAAKYMGGQSGTQTAKPSSVQKAGKDKAEPVKQVERQVVSLLAQPMGNAEVAATCLQERNRGFNTAVGGTAISDKNTLSACVYGAQSVTDGQAVRLRLLEPMAIADKIIPRNAVVVGTAKIQGERLEIGISSLEYDGSIIPPESGNFISDENLFNYQAKVLRELLNEESYICVGRAADFVLRDKPNVLTVYVDAPYDWRVEREMKRQGIGSSQAKHYIDKLDRYRESYYKYHTGRQWKRVENYDLCLDSAAIGLDNCVELIKKVIELKFDGKAK